MYSFSIKNIIIVALNSDIMIEAYDKKRFALIFSRYKHIAPICSERKMEWQMLNTHIKTTRPFNIQLYCIHVKREFILRSHYNAKHGLTDIDIEY